MTPPRHDAHAVSVTQGQSTFSGLLQEFDAQVDEGNLKAARKTLDKMQRVAYAQNDPATKSKMIVTLTTQDRRLTKLIHEKQVLHREGPPKTNAVCDLCGEPFRRAKGDTRRTACYVCRPDNKSRSVRALGGGLPTLGKNHR